MAKILHTRLKGEKNIYNSVLSALNTDAFAGVSGTESFGELNSVLDKVQGMESASFVGTIKSVLNGSNTDAFLGAAQRDPFKIDNESKKAFEDLTSITGYEGFSMQNDKGSEQSVKAINMTLNAQNHRQTKAAEELFRTVSVRYEDEGANLVVRAAGLGTYVYGATAWQSASDLRPIFGLLRTGEMFKDDVLALFPVYPADDADDNREFFVDEDFANVEDHVYPTGDAYGRGEHDTQMLAVPVTIPNLLGLSQAPGQRPWTSTDEIESNSISVKRLGVSGQVGGTDASFFINTTAMSNNTFGPSTQVQSSDDRALSMYIKNLPGFTVTDKDGVAIGETLFADIKAAGYEPLLQVSFTGNYQRQGNELRLNGGQVTISGLRPLTKDANGKAQQDIKIGNAGSDVKPLFKTLSTATVAGADLSYNVSNTSRGNFGYRIEVYDTVKHLSVRRRSPVSVKYPVDKKDVNSTSLDYAIEQMSVVINNQCSKEAFDMAEEHVAYITSIDGAPVVGGAGDQGSNVLPAQHYLTAAAVNRSIKLADVVSAIDSTDVLAAVQAAISNEVSDITAALNTKSGLAAVAEYGGVDEKIDWSVIVHQNLARFLMKQGDPRTIGAWENITIEATNFDSMIGKMYIVPKNTSSEDSINPIGGIGVNISKENVVVQGMVTRDQQDFGVVMTMPAYRHWALNVVIGTLTIEDAYDFLKDEGLLSRLAVQRVSVKAADEENGILVNTAGGEEPVDPNA